MKQLSVLICAATLAAFTHVPTLAQTPNLSLSADSLFAEWNKPGSPGAAVGVVHGGKLIYAKGFGEADIETGAPITPQTIFHVASLSKQFSAYAIVLLAQDGKLALDDDIRKYIPEVPDFGKTITIRHLIHHTSGLRDQWNLLAMAGWRLDDVITKEQIFNLLKRQQALNFEPGAEFSYCNTGYTLLAEVVARVGKQPFGEWMQQRLFKPLGMNNTLFYEDHERIVKGRAYSFYKAPQGDKNPFKKSVLSYANAGATSLFTTVTDLANWIANFRTPVVGNAATMKQMLERGRLTKGDSIPYAFALSHGTYRGLTYYDHSGADAGFQSFLCYFPQQDYGFIVLSNQAELSAPQKAFDLAALYLGSSLNKPEAPAVASLSQSSQKDKVVYPIDSTLFDRQFAGSYELIDYPGMIMTYQRKGKRYLAQVTAQGELEIFPSSDTTFFYKAVNAGVVFHRPKTGQAISATHQQNGNYRLRRVMPYVPSAQDKQQLVGSYFSPELETIYTVKLQKDTLKLVHIHHGETPLVLSKVNQLRTSWWFAPDMTVVRDPANQITGLRMSSGRVRNVWFKRLPTNFDQVPVATVPKPKSTALRRSK